MQPCMPSHHLPLAQLCSRNEWAHACVNMHAACVCAFAGKNILPQDKFCSWGMLSNCDKQIGSPSQLCLPGPRRVCCFPSTRFHLELSPAGIYRPATSKLVPDHVKQGRICCNPELSPAELHKPATSVLRPAHMTLSST